MKLVRDQLSDVRQIAQGIRSRIYLGTDPVTSATVVVKVFDTSMVADRRRDDFVNHASRLSTLSEHPNIATIFGVLHRGPQTVVVLEQYCPGSCRLLLSDGQRLNPAQIIAIGMRACDALAHIHTQGQLHLDLTAGHIRFADESTPCLADLGVSYLYPALWRLSHGHITTAACHIPPELVEEGAPTAASDIYSLASVLYEMLVGRTAIETFTGDTPAALCVRILNQQIAPVVAPGVPSELSDLLLRCLDRDPANRPTSAHELKGCLEKASLTLGSAWTGRLAIPKPTGVLATHDTVMLWSHTDGH